MCVTDRHDMTSTVKVTSPIQPTNNQLYVKLVTLEFPEYTVTKPRVGEALNRNKDECMGRLFPLDTVLSGRKKKILCHTVIPKCGGKNPIYSIRLYPINRNYGLLLPTV